MINKILEAETTIEELCKKMASEFLESDNKWPKAWMEKYVSDRKILIEARRVLIEQAERISTKLA